MSFLVDPPSLYAAGRAYARVAPERAQGTGAQVAGAATVAVFWAASAGLWTNQDWAQLMWRATPARSGRELQVTSGLFRWTGARNPPTAAHAAAAVALATYPLFYWLGWDAGRRRRPRA